MAAGYHQQGAVLLWLRHALPSMCMPALSLQDCEVRVVTKLGSSSPFGLLMAA